MITELKRFLNVCSTGSLTKSAKLLNITQPALSQSLQRLEKNLSTKLINRKNRQFFITEDGKAIYHMGEKLLRIWESMQDPALRKTKKISYTLGLFDNAAIQLAKEIDYIKKPQLIELVIDVSSKLKLSLKQGILDMCIAVLDKNQKEVETANIIKTYFENLVPVSSKKFSSQLEKVPFLLYNKDSYTRAYIDEVFAKNSINPVIFAESTSITFLKELAMLGKGVALLPENFIANEIKNKLLVRQNFKLKWYREIGIFLHKESGLSQVTDFVKNIVEKLTFTKALVSI